MKKLIAVYLAGTWIEDGSSYEWYFLNMSECLHFLDRYKDGLYNIAVYRIFVDTLIHTNIWEKANELP